MELEIFQETVYEINNIATFKLGLWPVLIQTSGKILAASMCRTAHEILNITKSRKHLSGRSIVYDAPTATSHTESYLSTWSSRMFWSRAAKIGEENENSNFWIGVVDREKIIVQKSYRMCPSRYRTRHFFNNSDTNEDIVTKFEQGYVRCVRNEEECVCSVCL
jgi:hypothetical protein